MLCNGHCNTCYINFLEAVLAKHAYAYVARNGNHGYTVHICRCDTRNKVAGTGAACCKANAYLARCTRITVGSMCRALLVRSKVMLYLMLMLVKRIVDIKYGTARITEYRIYTLLFQTLY